MARSGGAVASQAAYFVSRRCGQWCYILAGEYFLRRCHSGIHMAGGTIKAKRRVVYIVETIASEETRCCTYIYIPASYCRR